MRNFLYEMMLSNNRAGKPSPGLEGVKVLPSGPWFAAGVSTAPLLPDAAYMGLVLSMPVDMSAGRLVDDDDALLPGAADDDDGLTGTAKLRSALLSTDAGVGTGRCAHRWHESCQAAVARMMTIWAL